ncbi:MAG: hypothetical protein R3304_09175 [Longimicrobiales bacterium]|nr:hypothetical protein [Longimicrobiales bacterium]
MNLSLRILETTLFLTLLGAAPLTAQSAALLVEARGGAAFPVGDFRDGVGPGEGAAAGPSLQVSVALPSGGWRTLYVGFDQHRFPCEDAGCGPDGRYVATGFHGGLRIVPVQGRFTPWLRLGAITTRVETGDLASGPAGATDAGVSDLGFGGEVGLGFMVRLGRWVGWSASGLVSAVSSDLPGGETLDLRYVSAHTGLTFVF